MDVSLILCRCPRSLHHIPPTALALPFLHKIGVILCRRHWTDSLTYIIYGIIVLFDPLFQACIYCLLYLCFLPLFLVDVYRTLDLLQVQIT